MVAIISMITLVLGIVAARIRTVRRIPRVVTLLSGNHLWQPQQRYCQNRGQSFRLPSCNAHLQPSLSFFKVPESWAISPGILLTMLLVAPDVAVIAPNVGTQGVEGALIPSEVASDVTCGRFISALHCGIQLILIPRDICAEAIQLRVIVADIAIIGM